ncbi:putative disease resistance RPP13-like protein 1 [Pistacia vera]|uniref:putative disease resistance RPP13-like protein 1 n=1 Tax=Pistacia vera TaxID=55513 RepID=UPI0012636D63|nr:putative disease resistance RPP13-like protein 1 [Pistacia vera]
MAVGEVFLGAFLQVFFDRLADRRLLSFLRESGIDIVIKQWKKKLSMIQAVLNDAEEKQLTNKAVKMWLDDLQDLAYYVEDILDEYATQLAERKLMTTDHPTNSFTDYFSSLMSNRHMKSQIEEITDRLEDLCDQRDCLGLKEIAGGTSTATPQRLPTTSLQLEPAVIGRDDDKAKLLEMMLRDKPSDANFHVIPIVGMGGIGKTTLAREVFNDQAAKDFDPKVWVCVSDNDHFDVQKIYKAILEEITSKSCDVETFNQLQVKLRSQVVGKKFLLVLDDLWNEDYGNWEILKSPFMAGASGSRIIVTTRNLNVVSTMTGSIESHNVQLLSEEDCWSVFAKHAFENRDIAKFTNLEYIRLKVASKCNGLPLAARTLGGLLRCEQRESKWNDILDSKIWEDILNSSQHGEIPKVLKLSYHRLPSHLKRCFAYCATFPKNYQFNKKDLVLFWMAEGLIQESKYNKELEDIGGEYFQDLLSRSLFQKSSNTSTYVIHNLISDLAKQAFGDTSFRLEDELRTNNQSEALKKIRHLSIRHLSTKFEALHEAVNFRTMLEVNCVASDIDFPNFLPKFKKLRVLSVMSDPDMFPMSVPVISLPDTIGDMKHLRYLNLSNIKITSLPESTNSLINLEVLQLRRCMLIEKLPPMGNLINLHHLNIQGVNLIEMPLGMENWKNLRTLSNFVVGKDIRSGLDVLKNF